MTHPHGAAPRWASGPAATGRRDPGRRRAHRGPAAAALAVVATAALAVLATAALWSGAVAPASAAPVARHRPLDPQLGAGHTRGSRHRDPRTAAALLRIARAFNLDYAHNKDAAVYARWDAASRAVISRKEYLLRHRECPNPPEAHVDTWGVTRGPHGAWLVHYSIGGIQFVDYWFYVHGRFVFDLPKSNPSAVPLYRSSPAAYAKAVGCDH